jgi:ABC-type lipoprotein release transport system permease subunit
MIYYVPIRQQILSGAPTNIFIRSGEVDAATIRNAAMSASPQIRYAIVEPWSDVTAPELRPWTLGAAVLGAFGVLALLVAALGLYSVFAFDVAARSRELGIRSALGAARARLFSMVVRDVLLLSGIGAALGLALVIVARRWVDPLLYETSAVEVSSLLPVALVLVGVAFLAAAIPGSRAARADPIDALRAE